jgi:hypothetical protein
VQGICLPIRGSRRARAARFSGLVEFFDGYIPAAVIERRRTFVIELFSPGERAAFAAALLDKTEDGLLRREEWNSRGPR